MRENLDLEPYTQITQDLVSYKSKTRMQASFSESIFMCMPTMCYACPGLPSPRPRTFSVRLCVEAGHGAQDHEAHPSFCRRGSCGLKSKETGGDREWSRNCVHSCTPPSYYPALLGVYLCARHWSFLELWNTTDTHTIPGYYQALCGRQDMSDIV